MQPRRLEEPAPVSGDDRVLERIAVAIQPDGNFHSGLAERPNAPEHSGETANLPAANGPHHVAGAQSGALRRTAIRKPDHNDAVLDLGRIEPEPRAGRSIGPAIPQQVVEDRL